MKTEKEFKIPIELGKKWVSELRSGNYNQITGTLHILKTNCYCADGIYAKVCGYEFDKFGSDAYLNGESVYSDNTGLMLAVYRLNDTHKYTFSEIADWIEENVEFV